MVLTLKQLNLVIFFSVIKILESSEKNCTNLRVIVAWTTAYSMIALKILKMQVTMKLSMAFS